MRRETGPLTCLKHVIRESVLLSDVPVGLESGIADIRVLRAIGCILVVRRAPVGRISRRALMAIAHNGSAGSVHVAIVVRRQPAVVMVVIWVGAVGQWSGV